MKITDSDIDILIILTLDIQSLHKLDIDKTHYVDCCCNMLFLLQFTTIIVLVGHTTFTGIPILPILADICTDTNTDINIGWPDNFFYQYRYTDISTDTDTDINIGVPLYIGTQYVFSYSSNHAYLFI